MNDKWEFYKDAENKWRWRRTAPNGNIVGASTEGYVNKTDCEGNARRNGWNANVLFQERDDKMIQKDLNEENKDIKSKAYELYKEHGFKDGNDFVDWLEAEKQAGKRSRAKSSRQIRNILSSIIAILFAIVAMLLFTLFREAPPAEVTQTSLSELKVVTLVIDPKENEKIVVFGDTHFAYDKSTLSQGAKTLLDDDVQILKDNPKTNVRMAGYTSAKGSEEVNQKLSEERANAVRDYLIEKGIAPGRITTIGYGRTKPALYEVVPGDKKSKEAKANMRVLFEVVVK